MATATHSHIDHGIAQPRPLTVLTMPFVILWNALGSVSTATRQAKQIEQLSMLSDSQLKARGLRREDIGRHVLGL